MRRDDGRPTSGELPTDDVPSAEVLDELLRAFAADTDDAQALRQVDLESPEVDALLAPTAPTPPPGTPSADPPVEVEVEVEVGEQAEPEVEVESADAPGDDEVVAEADEPPAEPQTEPPTEPPSEVPSQASTRTIVIDAADDPPDAVYLAAGDPLLAASAGARGLTAAPTDRATDGAPVFIDDAAVEAGETISVADASSATRIEPRMRERRIAVKRAVGRKRLRWVLVVAVVLVLVVAALAVLGSSMFAIDEVRVEGAVQTDPVRLQAVVDELEGTPVLRADTEAAERALEAIPWVDAARVTARFPDRATIELRERRPVATYQGPDQRFRLVDIEGRVLQLFDGQPVDFLVITSLDATDLEPGQFGAQGLVAAANLVQALTPEMRAVAVGVSVTGDGSDLRLQLTEGREVRFGAGRDLVVKLVRLQTKLIELAGSGFRFLDVSTDQVTMG